MTDTQCIDMDQLTVVEYGAWSYSHSLWLFTLEHLDEVITASNSQQSAHNYYVHVIGTSVSSLER